MSLKRIEIYKRQEADFKKKLADRMAYLKGKGIDAAAADKDTIVRHLKAKIRAVKNRLTVIAGPKKPTEDQAKMKAKKADVAPQDKAGEEKPKSKKPPEGPKEKRAKPEKKSVPPKGEESGKA